MQVGELWQRRRSPRSRSRFKIGSWPASFCRRAKTKDYRQQRPEQLRRYTTDLIGRWSEVDWTGAGLGNHVSTPEEFGRYAFAIQSAISIPGVRTVLYVNDLDTLDLTGLAEVAAVHYRWKGFSSHTEVICRIKGISLVQVDELEFTQGARVLWPKRTPDPLATGLSAFPGKFQAVIFDSSDLAGLNFTRIDTVFIRFEHLLYGAVAKTRVRPGPLAGLQESIRAELAAVARALPDGVTLLVRGLDVRSDDRVLAGYFFHSKEANPELGQHGTRYLQGRPDLVGFMAAMLRGLPAEVRFACPFVTTHHEYQAFSERYSDLFDLPIVPFAESPSIFFEASKYRVDKLCIGLKDVAQFYFAADRANPNVADAVSYTDDGLLCGIVGAVRTAVGQGVAVYLHQQADFFKSYAVALGRLPWMPSLAVSELKYSETEWKE
ncbi:hypothetical protein EAD89_17090 [Micromonospora sp. BL4]|nr:hypothetical protein EAD89_17090 [Micromonospora sp. BL4]